jgi:hypothetical protein
MAPATRVVMENRLFSSVDFPAPLGPMMTRISFSSTSMLMFSMTGAPP